MDSEKSEEKIQGSGRSSDDIEIKDGHIIGIKDMPSDDSTAAVEDTSKAEPNYHIKTYLTVFAVCLIYLAQAFNIVGAGAVSRNTFSSSRPNSLTRGDSSLEIFQPRLVARQNQYGYRPQSQS